MSALRALHPDTPGRKEQFRAEFVSAGPFRHLVIEPFLAPGMCDRLLEEFPRFDAARAVNELGQVGGKAHHERVTAIGDAYRDFDRLMRAPEFLAWMEEVTGIERLLYDPDYVGGGTHENLPGQELDLHVDFNYHPRTHWHRRLNLILFLNREWQAAWGGNLELHRDPWGPAENDLVRQVTPAANRCVIFETTEQSWHGFDRIAPPSADGISRKSVAVYFYTAARPPGETAPSHGTVYVPRPLPGHYQPGRALTEADVLELRTLIARRDQQIRFLYEREKEISEVLEGITRSRWFRAAHPLFRLLRAVRGR